MFFDNNYDLLWLSKEFFILSGLVYRRGNKLSYKIYSNQKYINIIYANDLKKVYFNKDYMSLKHFYFGVISRGDFEIEYLNSENFFFSMLRMYFKYNIYIYIYSIMFKYGKYLNIKFFYFFYLHMFFLGKKNVLQLKKSCKTFKNNLSSNNVNSRYSKKKLF